MCVRWANRREDMDKDRNEQLDCSRKLKLTAVNNRVSSLKPQRELQSIAFLFLFSFSKFIFFMTQNKSHVDCLYVAVQFFCSLFCDDNYGEFGMSTMRIPDNN